MKKIVSLLLSAFTLMCGASDLAAQTQRYSISGKVIDSSSKEPLMGVYVTTDNNLGAQTDRSGNFTIKNVPAGEYTLRTMYYSDFSQDEKKVTVNGNLSGITLSISQEGMKLEQVVVTATRTEKRLSEAPELTTVINERDIEKAGSTSLLETLQDNIPGIVMTENAMGNNMRIRGLNSRYILILVDGERLVSEGAGGNINLDQIDVNNIKRIEVLNGAASALYGSNAVGGVINIITKDPIHKLEAGANVTAQSNNTWRTRVDLGSATEKIDVRAGGFRNSSDGYDKNNSYAAKYEDWGSEVKFGYKPTKQIDLHLNGRYFRHETFNTAESSDPYHTMTHNISAGFNGGVRSKDASNELRASVSLEKYFKYKKSDEVSLDDVRDQTSSYISSKLIDTYKLNDKWEFVGGAEFNYEEIYARTTLGSEPVTKDNNDINGFAQAEYKPIEDLDIVLGARYTNNSQFGSAFSPKLAVKYDLGDFRFRGGVGSAFRAPSIKELYYNFDHQGMFWIYGNPDLKAEKGLYTSLSTEYDNGNLNIAVSAYYNNIDDKITQYQVINGNQNEQHYKNVSSSTIQGFDVNLTYTIINQIVLRGNYSFCDAKDNDTKKQIASNPKNSGTASVTWNGKIARSPFSLQLAGRMNSPTIVSDQKTKTYSIWKVTLTKPFRLNKHTFELTLKADNVFGFKDRAFTNPGRQWLAGIRYKFK